MYGSFLNFVGFFVYLSKCMVQLVCLQVKLFVKYMPHCCSPEKAVSLFLVYGQVHLLEYHSEHKDKLFLVSCTHHHITRVDYPQTNVLL